MSAGTAKPTTCPRWRRPLAYGHAGATRIFFDCAANGNGHDTSGFCTHCASPAPHEQHKDAADGTAEATDRTFAEYGLPARTDISTRRDDRSRAAYRRHVTAFASRTAPFHAAARAGTRRTYEDRYGRRVEKGLPRQSGRRRRLERKQTHGRKRPRRFCRRNDPRPAARIDGLTRRPHGSLFPG